MFFVSFAPILGEPIRFVSQRSTAARSAQVLPPDRLGMVVVYLYTVGEVSNCQANTTSMTRSGTQGFIDYGGHDRTFGIVTRPASELVSCY